MFSSSIKPVTTILHTNQRYTVLSITKKAVYKGFTSERSIKREMEQVLHPRRVHPYRRLHLSSFQ